jgi:DNA polymerase
MEWEVVQALSCDFETASRANLKQVGASKYARDNSTFILCLSYTFDSAFPRIWFPGQPFPQDLADHVATGGEVHAWNAAFEWNIWNYTLRRLFPDLPELALSQCHCSMATALFWGLPAKLEQAAKVATPGVHKDKEGHSLMLRMTRPRSVDKDGTVHWWHIEEPARLARLGEYCQQDVIVERGVAQTVPAMPAAERQVWLLDQRMNDSGLYLDQQLVTKMRRVVATAMDRLSVELAELTGGEVTSHRQGEKIKRILRNGGLDLDSLDKRYLPDILRADLTNFERSLLTLYQRGAKASLAKLQAMQHTVCEDSRIRGLVQYGGAMRTLRWAGRGVQIQNYPRPMKDLDTNWAVKDILADADDVSIGFVHGETLEVISSCLRGCYVAAPGRVLCVRDYSAIEARGVGWLAGQSDLLDQFRVYDRTGDKARDPYTISAGQSGSTNRTLGKVKVLACGYGMGPPKFQVTAEGYELFLTLEQSQDAVWSWRSNNAEIVALWYAYDDATRRTIQTRSSNPISVGPVSFRMGKNKLAGSLLMQLPSGRCIVYRNARLVEAPLRDRVTKKIIKDKTEVKIAYDGLVGGKWMGITTWGGKLVENATQAVARDILADAMLRLDAAGVPLNTTIHDEIIAEPEARHASETLAVMQAVMGTPPSWGTGLPLGSSGAVMHRYGKG